MTILILDSGIISKWSSKPIDDARGVIYNHEMFKVQVAAFSMSEQCLLKSRQLRNSCRAKDFSHEWDKMVWNLDKTESFSSKKTFLICCQSLL
jgi:hypothetical protein